MNITVFGEILWDIFGDDKKIGGAPFNFGAHFTKLGGCANVVSAVGDDELGKKALLAVNELGLSTDSIAVLEKPTGYCQVTLNNGTPSYELVKNVAYDFIPRPDEKYYSADALYIGTLAQRSTASQRTADSLLSGNFKEVFFDINIRQNFYTKELIDKVLKRTTIFKISREEIGVLDLSGTNEEICEKLSEKYDNIKLIIVTLDCDGAFVFDCTSKEYTYSEKPNGKVVSTVGAGDSFSSCFLYNYLNGASIKECLTRASALSGYVVSQLGAIPDYPDELLTLVK